MGRTEDFAVHMKGSHFNRSEVAKAYKTVYHSMITYSLEVTTLSHKQLTTVQSTAKTASLPKISFNRKLPKDILRGPHLYEGYGNPALYTIKGYRLLKFLIGHLRNKDDIGKMLKQELEHL